MAPKVWNWPYQGLENYHISQVSTASFMEHKRTGFVPEHYQEGFSGLNVRCIDGNSYCSSKQFSRIAHVLQHIALQLIKEV